MERELQERERAVRNLLAAADYQGADLVRESLPRVRVVGACGCGCESFDLLDMRYPAPEHPGIEDWSSVVSEDGLTSIVLWIDNEGRPTSWTS
jgi:hypothetical protein